MKVFSCFSPVALGLQNPSLIACWLCLSVKYATYSAHNLHERFAYVVHARLCQVFQRLVHCGAWVLAQNDRHWISAEQSEMFGAAAISSSNSARLCTNQIHFGRSKSSCLCKACIPIRTSKRLPISWSIAALSRAIKIKIKLEQARANQTESINKGSWGKAVSKKACRATVKPQRCLCEELQSVCNIVIYLRS